MTCKASRGTCCSSCLHNGKITTKVNIWGQVYFDETSSSLVSKIRNSAGCSWFEASCQGTLSPGCAVLLFVVACLEIICVCPSVQTHCPGGKALPR